jgi:hypothetical protein
VAEGGEQAGRGQSLIHVGKLGGLWRKSWSTHQVSRPSAALV